jgi:nucleotide-binding universal stress UspA family protein
VRSPFFSESEGFEFVLLTVAAFTAIVIASLYGGAWVGLPVWAAATTGAVLFYARRGRAARGIQTAPAQTAVSEERRVLVVEFRQLDDEAVELVRTAAAGRRAEVLLLHPASVSTVDHWASSVDAARAQAKDDLDAGLARLRAAGIEAQGEVGDEDPLQAIEDALRTFGADEIVMWTGEGSDRSAVERTRRRFALPVTA